ncbi:creatininase family protein [Burkholderiaceae bacterium UC74_6]
MSWVEARAALTPQTVVVIPLGAESKEHGPHLPLNTDFRQAEYYKQRVLAAADVVVAPTVNYSFYPNFVEYPGATSLSLGVSRDMLLEIVRGLASFGPRRFYVLNTGVSTNRPLAQVRARLAAEGIALAYLDPIGPRVKATESQVETQQEGAHADEIETSMMLDIDASIVDMSKATVEYLPRKANARGIWSLDPKSPLYNPSGIYGDATRATAAKGRFINDAKVRVMLDDIEALRRAPLPVRLERQFVNGSLVSANDPAASFTVNKDFHYIGGQRIDLFKLAGAEQHFFVDVSPGNSIRRFYWLQFEQFHPDNDKVYNYAGIVQQPVPLGRLLFMGDVRVSPNYFTMDDRPGSDSKAAENFLRSLGLNIDGTFVTLRLFHLTDASRRKELMVIYGERLMPDTDASAVKAQIIERAQTGMELR